MEQRQSKHTEDDDELDIEIDDQRDLSGYQLESDDAEPDDRRRDPLRHPHP